MFGDVAHEVEVVDCATSLHDLGEDFAEKYIPAARRAQARGEPLRIGPKGVEARRGCKRGEQRERAAQAAQRHAQLVNSFRVAPILGRRLIGEQLSERTPGA